MPSGTLIYKHIWKEPDYHKTTLFQDISSKKKRKYPFLLEKLLTFQFVFIFSYHVAQKGLCKFTIIKKIVNN